MTIINANSENLEVADQVEAISPFELVSPSRLDLAVKYLHFKSLKLGFHIPEVDSLYRRHILLRTGGIEPVDPHGAHIQKSSVEDYFACNKLLLDDLQQNGFSKSFPVPIGSNGLPDNGAHRLAASLALGSDVYIKRCKQAGGTWDFEWFKSHGFSSDDLMRVLKGFIEIAPNKTGIFVLWAPVEKHWDQITTAIEKHVRVVGHVDIGLEDGGPGALAELIRDIYKCVGSQGYGDTIERKIELLQHTALKLRVVVVWDASTQNMASELYEKLRRVKQNCRDLLGSDIDKNAFLTLHSSDTEDELNHMAATLLSPNNLQRLRQRPTSGPRKVFSDWMEEFLKICGSQSIQTRDVCIVGSSPLEVLGVRASTDIDFTMTSFLRQRFGSGVTHLSENVDIVTEKYHRTDERPSASDDALISLDDLHFMYRGLKFADLDVVYDRKKYSARDKDLRDVGLIDAFRKNSLVKDRNQIAQFQRRISNEIYLRELEKSIRNLELRIANLENQGSQNSKKVLSRIVGILKKFLPDSAYGMLREVYRKARGA